MKYIFSFAHYNGKQRETVIVEGENAKLKNGFHRYTEHSDDCITEHQFIVLKEIQKELATDNRKVYLISEHNVKLDYSQKIENNRVETEQAITEQDILNIENGIAITDMDLRLMELEAHYE